MVEELILVNFAPASSFMAPHLFQSLELVGLAIKKRGFWRSKQSTIIQKEKVVLLKITVSI